MKGGDYQRTDRMILRMVFNERKMYEENFTNNNYHNTYSSNNIR